MNIDYKFLIILALIAWIALKDSCNPEEPVLVRRDTLITYYTPPPVNVTLPPTPPTKVIIREIPATVDSFQIVQDYYTSREYERTYRTDSIEIFVRSKVFRNSLDTQTVRFNFLQPPCSTIFVKEQITLPPTRKLLIGLQVGYSDQPFLLPTLAYQPRTGHLFLGSFNGRGGSIGYLHKIRFGND